MYTPLKLNVPLNSQSLSLNLQKIRFPYMVFFFFKLRYREWTPSSLDEYVLIEELFVCKYIEYALTPAFTKIKAIVTNTYYTNTKKYYIHTQY